MKSHEDEAISVMENLWRLNRVFAQCWHARTILNKLPSGLKCFQGKRLKVYDAEKIDSDSKS